MKVKQIKESLELLDDDIEIDTNNFNEEVTKHMMNIAVKQLEILQINQDTFKALLNSNPEDIKDQIAKYCLSKIK